MSFVVVPSRQFLATLARLAKPRADSGNANARERLTDAAIRKEDEEDAGPEEDGHAEQAEDRADHDEDDIDERMPTREVVSVLAAQEIPHERVHVPHRLPATISLAS